MEVELKNLDILAISVLFMTPAMQADTEFGSCKAEDFCWNGVAGVTCRSKAHIFVFKQMCKAIDFKYLAQFPLLMHCALRYRLIICILSLALCPCVQVQYQNLK